MDPIQTAMAQALSGLEAAKALIDTEISDYPTPIAGCDAQFNHLLAEQRKVARALRELKSEVFIPTPRQLNPA